MKQRFVGVVHMRKPVTIFTFGYKNWGNATKYLIQAVDAVEASRKHRPPLFVDIRIHRDVLAAGFHGDAFEKTIGKDRYQWMPTLGNLAVRADLKDSLDDTYICHPDDAEKLLTLAYQLARKRQRLIVFCSCERPSECHRYTVGQLLKRAARRRGRPLEVIEWPGGEPRQIKDPVPVSNRSMPSAVSPRLHLKRQRPFPLATYAGLACGSTVRVDINGEERTFAVGSAMRDSHGWYLPVLRREISIPIAATDAAVRRYRKDWCYSPVKSR